VNAITTLLTDWGVRVLTAASRAELQNALSALTAAPDFLIVDLSIRALVVWRRRHTAGARKFPLYHPGSDHDRQHCAGSSARHPIRADSRFRQTGERGQVAGAAPLQLGAVRTDRLSFLRRKSGRIPATGLTG